jgi:hypothetical protein
MIVTDLHPLGAALAYAAGGWHVLPLCWPDEQGACACGRVLNGSPAPHEERDAGKAPLTWRGCYDATTDAATIRAWWSRWPQANVGIALEPSGLLVIDTDSPDAEKEAAHLSGLAGLPPAPIARTGRRDGGWHHYYQRPEGCPVATTTHQGSSGAIDVKSNGYMVAPPSRHASGITYQWQTPPALGCTLEVA